jgi:hypothetical protein
LVAHKVIDDYKEIINKIKKATSKGEIEEELARWVEDPMQSRTWDT